MTPANKHHPAIIFDFGGVLIDWDCRYLYRKLFTDPDALERFLVEVGFREWNLEQDKGRPFAEGVAELCAQFPHYAVQIKAYDERWEESIGGAIQPTVELLDTLKQVGYPLYGLSNWSAEKFRLVRYKYAFFDWFDLIMLSGEAKLNKPDPRLFALFLNTIGRMASECVFIDDSATNVAAARRLGFTTIQYESPEQLKLDLQAMGLLP